MKHLLFSVSGIVSLVCLFCFAQCRKERIPFDKQQGLNIVLHNKPLDTIRFYIQRTWQLQSAKRRSTWGDIKYSITNTTYWRFTSDNRITQIYGGLILSDTTINWLRNRDAYNGDSTFIMTFSDKRGHLPYSYAIDSIFNDTLVLHENTIDATIYYFTQKNKKDTGLSMTLYDEPLDFIQSYIQGKWRLHYTFGGICGTCKFDRETNNEYYEFLPNLRIVYTYKNSIEVDTTYKWITHQVSPSDYIHNIIEYYDKRSLIHHFEVVNTINDTMVLAEPFLDNPDYMLYFMTKNQ